MKISYGGAGITMKEAFHLTSHQRKKLLKNTRFNRKRNHLFEMEPELANTIYDFL